MRATRGSRPHVGACCLCPSTSEVFTVCAVLVVGRDGPDADRGPPPPHGARDATPIYAGHRHRHTRCREIQSAYTASAIGVTAAGGAPRAARETRRVGGGGPELSRMFRTRGGGAAALPSRGVRINWNCAARSAQRPGAPAVSVTPLTSCAALAGLGHTQTAHRTHASDATRDTHTARQSRVGATAATRQPPAPHPPRPGTRTRPLGNDKS